MIPNVYRFLYCPWNLTFVFTRRRKFDLNRDYSTILQQRNRTIREIIFFLHCAPFASIVKCSTYDSLRELCVSCSFFDIQFFSETNFYRITVSRLHEKIHIERNRTKLVKTSSNVRWLKFTEQFPDVFA